MEASSPISAAGKAPRPSQPPMSPAGTHAPSTTLPFAFILTGVLALFAGVLWLIIRPAILSTYHYNQYVIAATHLFVLGWICSVVMGAVYQLVPVALETRLYSEKLARCQYLCHVIGFIGMVWMFQVWNMKQVGHFGSLLAFGVGLFVYNIIRTLLRVPKWNVTAAAVTSALFWISLAIIAGLSIAAAKCAYDPDSAAESTGMFAVAVRSIANRVAHFDAIGAMHAHAHLGALGCFTMLIVGVSYKLIPMFTLSEVQSRRRATGSIALLNVGLAGSFVTILLRSPWKPAFALTTTVALAVYGWELRAMLRSRKRRTIDWGIKYFLSAMVLLGPLSVLALVLSWPGLPPNQFTGQLENLYGFLGFIGVISLAIIGMLYKILPFLVWFSCYSQEIGKRKVPALAEMYSSSLQAIGYWIYLAGLLWTGCGILAASESIVRCGGGMLALSLVTLALNLAKMLSHYFKPQLKSLNLSLSTVARPA